MDRKNRTFIAAFCMTMLLFVGFCGFAAVDLSTERYMPGRFGPFFEIYGVTASGADFAFMSSDYRLDFAPLEQASAVLARYRGLLPQSPRAAAALTVLARDKLLAKSPTPSG